MKPQTKSIEVSLADVYNGKDVEVDIQRQTICKPCNGVGGTDDTAVVKCTGCKGRGVRTIMRQMGPGMYSQSTGPCDECNGQGERIDMEKRCKVCKGKKVSKERVKKTVPVEKGCQNGE